MEVINCISIFLLFVQACLHWHPETTTKDAVCKSSSILAVLRYTRTNWPHSFLLVLQQRALMWYKPCSFMFQPSTQSSYEHTNRRHVFYYNCNKVHGEREEEEEEEEEDKVHVSMLQYCVLLCLNFLSFQNVNSCCVCVFINRYKTFLYWCRMFKRPFILVLVCYSCFVCFLFAFIFRNIEWYRKLPWIK